MNEQQISEMLPVLAPIVIIALVMLAIALNDLRQRSATRGPKWMWVAIICCGGLLGSVAYLAAGRKEE